MIRRAADTDTDTDTDTAATDDIDVRTVTKDELPDWCRALNTGFMRSPATSPETVAKRLAHFDLARTRAAFAPAGDGRGTRQVATFRSFAQDLSVPGGATVPTDAVTNVTVSPTHRRRGLLSRMMAADLAEAKERGDVAATLISAEYRIYGRYGFGPAATATQWEIDVPRTGLDPRRSGPDDGGRIDLADAEEVRRIGPGLYERLRARAAGATDRDAFWWQYETGLWPTPEDTWNEPFYAVYRSARGEVEGLVVYRSDGHWGTAKMPANTATVQKLIGVTPAAERALWHYLCSIDWVTTVRTDGRAPDDLVPHLLPDPRAARIVTQADFLWVRILDVVRALKARSYEASGELVLEVHDRAGLAGGRFRLAVTPDEVVCEPSAAAPQLTLDISELGALWLGDASAVRLAALGRLVEEKAGAVAVADALLRTPRRPWCPDMF
ncbi:GNAT family N-acetyltransferase [Streptomyces kunmingensis]|uniref:GNAT family N-acetyltransferase n=1 Tax=Streptomyces kunmingensis TaxID=68225 RepID=A0ABU6C647_9ACTN|nr:GNAT family N-acetyltransferase [Streptomyces kunmingensis]MEB3960058.1 GNAT family N-acetyltransferase [Streptomyces kunmingensis]